MCNLAPVTTTTTTTSRVVRRRDELWDERRSNRGLFRDDLEEEKQKAAPRDKFYEDLGEWELVKKTNKGKSFGDLAEMLAYRECMKHGRHGHLTATPEWIRMVDQDKKKREKKKKKK